MGWLGRHFVQPGVLGWLSLIAVPVIIYLINRQRYVRRRWAAMEFLLRALRRSRRRLQIQNLLLLLLRIALLALLVLGAARPVVRQEGGALAAEAEQNWILALDDTYSMGYSESGRSAFEQARESLADLAEGVLKDGDRVALLRFGPAPQTLFEVARVNDVVRRGLVDALEGTRLTARGMRLGASMRLIDEIAGRFTDPTGALEPVNVVLFSDLQRKDWLGADAAGEPEVGDILRGLRQRGGVLSVARLRGSGSGQRTNVGITALTIHPELLAREVPVSIGISLRNPGPRDARRLDLTLRVRSVGESAASARDEEEAQLGEVIDVPAGETVTRSVPYRFDRAGDYVVEAEVRSDGLVIDNRRQRVVRVRDDIEVLLVDGDPAVDPAGRETFFLELALRPRDGEGKPGRRYSPFLPTYVSADQLGDTDWKGYSLVVLANVRDLPLPSLRGLERYVGEGGALLGFLGDNIDPDFYREKLYRGGEGLLPLRLEGMRGERETPVFLQFADLDHPVASFFAEHENTSYLRGAVVSFFRYWVADPASSRRDVRTLARFTDIDLNPAFFDAGYGRGRVMWSMSSADRDWTDFPVWQDWVVFLYESASYLLGFGARPFNLAVGEPFSRVWEPEEFASEVSLHVPAEREGGLSRERVLPQAMREIPGEGRFRISFEGTDAPGLYRLHLGRPHSVRGDTVEAFAVNVDPEEGDLREITADEFQDRYGVRPVGFDASARVRSEAERGEILRGREYAAWLLGVVVLLLILETVLAHRFARRASR